MVIDAPRCIFPSTIGTIVCQLYANLTFFSLSSAIRLILPHFRRAGQVLVLLPAVHQPRAGRPVREAAPRVDAEEDGGAAGTRTRSCGTQELIIIKGFSCISCADGHLDGYRSCAVVQILSLESLSTPSFRCDNASPSAPPPYHDQRDHHVPFPSFKPNQPSDVTMLPLPAGDLLHLVG